MSKHYRDYFWKEGLPIGIGPSPEAPPGISYKLPSDPYHKRVSIEKYRDGAFAGVVYDSALFNFRHLNTANQMSWQKAIVEESLEQAVCHIRDQDDRLILIEEYRFEENLCRECRAYSATRLLLSIQKMLYVELHDSFNGLILYDTNEHPVMSKKYVWDKAACAFSTLLEEKWTMKPE